MPMTVSFDPQQALVLFDDPGREGHNDKEWDQDRQGQPALSHLSATAEGWKLTEWGDRQAAAFSGLSLSRVGKTN